jgi:hypothetical protein
MWREVDSPSSSVDVKNEWIYNSMPPICIHRMDLPFFVTMALLGKQLIHWLTCRTSTHNVSGFKSSRFSDFHRTV